MNKIKLAPFPSVSIAKLEQLNAGCGEGQYNNVSSATENH